MYTEGTENRKHKGCGECDEKWGTWRMTATSRLDHGDGRRFRPRTFNSFGDESTRDLKSFEYKPPATAWIYGIYQTYDPWFARIAPMHARNHFSTLSPDRAISRMFLNPVKD